MNFTDWDLPKFFEELFDYCFPIDYHTEPPLDATLIHESGYCSHKPDVSTPGFAHHPNLSHMLYGCWGYWGYMYILY